MKPKTIYQDAYRDFLDRLRERRESLGISQDALSRRLGWPQQRVSITEAGGRRLDVLEYLRLASALGLTQVEAYELLVQSWDAVALEPLVDR